MIASIVGAKEAMYNPYLYLFSGPSLESNHVQETTQHRFHHLSKSSGMRLVTSIFRHMARLLTIV